LYTVYVIWTFFWDIYESLPVVLMDLKSSILREVSSRTRAPKAVLFRLATFLLEALIISKTLWNQKLTLEAIEYITITIFEIRRPRPIK
jgi:hypothetical protein